MTCSVSLRQLGGGGLMVLAAGFFLVAVRLAFALPAALQTAGQGSYQFGYLLGQVMVWALAVIGTVVCGKHGLRLSR